MAAQQSSLGQARAGPLAAGPGDAELIALALKGDRMAAGMFIHRHQAAVRAFLRSLCGRDERADELAQETFLRALRGEERHDRKRSTRPWLLSIARRLWMERLDKSAPPPITPPAADRAPPEHRAPPAAPTGRRLAEAERQAHMRRLLRQALPGLTPAQRLAVLLVHQQGLSLAQAAAVMRLRPAAAKAQLILGRAVLRKLLEPHMEDSWP